MKANVKEMRAVPTNGKVIVKPDDQIEETASGIILPNSEKRDPRRGSLFAVSEGRWQGGIFIETKLKPGAVVLFSARAGIEFELGGEKLIVMDETEILAVLKEVE